MGFFQQSVAAIAVGIWTLAGTGVMMSPTLAHTGAGAPDAGLEGELAAGVERLQLQLPLVNGPLTLDRVEQSGATLTIYGTFRADVTPEEWAQLDQIMPEHQCLTLGHLISRGAAIIYSLTDSASERREVRIDSCPGSEPGAI